MTVRVAVVGLGWAGRSIWLRRLLVHPAYEVVAAVDSEPVVRAVVAREHPGVRVFETLDELRAGEVDLAVVAVPNHLHAEVGCRLLAAGIPVFLEKPVCLNSAEADQLAAAEREGGAVLLAGSAARYRADVLALGDIVGSLGRIRHVQLDWIRAKGVPNASGWFTRRDLSGGGALVDLGWHLLDTLGLLLGPAGFDQVVGTVSRDFVAAGAWRAQWREEEGPVALESDVEDTARGFLVSESGVSVSLRASWASHEPLDVTTIKVEGSTGAATLSCTFGFSPNRRDGSTLTRVREGVAEPVDVPVEEIGAEYRRQLDELPALLADPGSAGRAIAEAHRTISVIERLYDSARLGRRTASPVNA